MFYLLNVRVIASGHVFGLLRDAEAVGSRMNASGTRSYRKRRQRYRVFNRGGTGRGRQCNMLQRGNLNHRHRTSSRRRTTKYQRAVRRPNKSHVRYNHSRNKSRMTTRRSSNDVRRILRRSNLRPSRAIMLFSVTLLNNIRRKRFRRITGRYNSQRRTGTRDASQGYSYGTLLRKSPKRSHRTRTGYHAQAVVNYRETTSTKGTRVGDFRQNARCGTNLRIATRRASRYTRRSQTNRNLPSRGTIGRPYSPMDGHCGRYEGWRAIFPPFLFPFDLFHYYGGNLRKHFFNQKRTLSVDIHGAFTSLLRYAGVIPVRLRVREGTYNVFYLTIIMVARISVFRSRHQGRFRHVLKIIHRRGGLRTFYTQVLRGSSRLIRTTGVNLFTQQHYGRRRFLFRQILNHFITYACSNISIRYL